MLNYDKLFKLLKANNITSYDLRKLQILSGSTVNGLRHDGIGLKAETLNRLCALLKCQPADLFEYIPDEASEAWAADIWEKLQK